MDFAFHTSQPKFHQNWFKPFAVIVIIVSLFLPLLISEPSTGNKTNSTRADANTFPVPVLEVDRTDLFTLETLMVDASGSYDPDGSIIGYFFQFEDGTESGWVETPVIEHVYLKERVYTIRLKVMDDLGAESAYWETITVNIKNRLPYIIIEEELEVKPNVEVNLEGYKCWDEDGYIINYSWEFEDNTTVYGVNATHVFEDPGIYNIFLTILDDDRKANKSSMRVVVLEPEVSSKRRLLGIAVIITVAVVGVLGIMFGRKALPGSESSRRHALLPIRSSALGSDALFAKRKADQWFKRFGSALPDIKNLGLSEHAEPFIFDLALTGMAEDVKVTKAAETDLFTGSELTPEEKFVLKAVLLAGTAGAAEKISKARKEIALKVYQYSKSKIIKHENLGGARYYVPRTAEVTALAAFIVRKFDVRNQADPKTELKNLSENDKSYIDKIVELLARCWKVAHSFKARAHSEPAKLYLTLFLCEKAGKRRFGSGNFQRSFSADRLDDEAEWLEELIELYNDLWNVLQFQEFQKYPDNSKIILTLHTFELIGEHKYLNIKSNEPNQSG